MDNVAGVNGIAVQTRQSATACSDIRNNTVTYPNGVLLVFWTKIAAGQYW